MRKPAFYRADVATLRDEPLDLSKHSVSAAGTSLRRLDLGRGSAVGSFVPNILPWALDCRKAATLADVVDVQTAVLGEHGDLDLVKPFYVFAERFSDVVDGEDVGDGRQPQVTCSPLVTRFLDEGRISLSNGAAERAPRAIRQRLSRCLEQLGRRFEFASSARRFQYAASPSAVELGHRSGR